MVDGTLSSCYAAVPHDLAHITMTPIQWFPRLIGLIFGKSKGSPNYINTFIDVEKWILPKGRIAAFGN